MSNSIIQQVVRLETFITLQYFAPHLTLKHFTSQISEGNFQSYGDLMRSPLEDLQAVALINAQPGSAHLTSAVGGGTEQVFTE